jgi:uncharacterized membrane protein YhaH (DUF805 family)
MHKWLRAPLGGRTFFGLGLALGLLKVAIDYAVSRSFDHRFSLLFYVDPLDAPLFHPGASLHYWMALAAVATPFAAIGVLLCARRLHDAALGSAYALLFFVPFAHLLFFVALALAPSRPTPLDLTLPRDVRYREPGAPLEAPPPPPMKRYPRSLAAVFGSVIGLGALGVSVGLFREYGAALILGSPCIAGFATGAFYARLAPHGTLWRAIEASLLSMAMMSVVVVAFAIEGLFCIVILLPLYAIPATLTAAVGYFAGRALPPARLDGVIVTSIMSFIALLALERVSPVPPLAPPPVVTSIDIDAPPSDVWPLIPNVATLPAPEELLFKAAIAYPVRAWMEGAGGVGATRVCEFDTGDAREVVDVWEPNRALGFRIVSQPEPMRELTLYRTFRQPHNDGYIINTRGELRIEPLPGNRSRLTGTSWYQVRLTPEVYWRGWIDSFIHRIHGRVMGAIKTRAEAPRSPEVAHL